MSMSKETQDLVASLMKETGLTAFQQRQLKDAMQQGSALPRSVHPDSSKPTVQKKPKASKPKKLHVDNIGHRRLKADIDVQTHGYARPQYQAKEAKDMSLERERLSDTMAFGRDIAEKKAAIRAKDPSTARGSSASSQRGGSSAGKQRKASQEVDLFDILVREIEERDAYLQKLRLVSKDKKQEQRILTEISQRIRQLELLDRQRSSQLRTKYPDLPN
eukprot:m.168469 g.168469  ORF g.168469 m.168469 type:complete len:218 (-) comp14478_c0_seq2:1619-2272(-)